MASLVVSSAESAQIDAAMTVADEIPIQYDSLLLEEVLFHRAWKSAAFQ
jgi:hypothetical protein